MITVNTIKSLIQDVLLERALTLIDIQISNSNAILVEIDKLKHVTIEDCLKISRQIEGNLNRDEEDFSLEVSSPGIDKPFKTEFQYQKYTGNQIEVITLQGTKHEGILQENTPDYILLNYTEVVKEGKKNVKKEQSLKIEKQNIKQTKLIISFKK
jgi:ribosome maturation factor RimP